MKTIEISFKQGFIEGYSQRLIDRNIVMQKLSRLKLSRLRPHKLKLSRLRPHRARLYRLKLYGSEAGSQRNYILVYES